MRQLKVGKSDLRSGINRNAVPSSSPTLPLRLRWELNEIGSINRNAVAPVLNAGMFPASTLRNGHNPFRVGEILASRSQGSRSGNLGLEDGTALRLQRRRRRIANPVSRVRVSPNQRYLLSIGTLTLRYFVESFAAFALE